MMDKQAIIQVLRDEIGVEINRLKAANKEASAEATDSESRAESKWDTHGLEASYLARGYANQFNSMNEQARILSDLSPASFAGKPIATGALVQCDFDGSISWVFLLPCCGGTDLVFDGQEVTVVTPESPLAAALKGKLEKGTYQLANGASGKILRVL